MALAVLPPPDQLPAGAVPEWIHLLPAGEIRPADGRGPYRIGNATELIAKSLAGGKLPLDENHATDLAGPRGKPAPARGWIVSLQQRADGIWGRVEWTGPGRRMMADREYRGVSPAIVHRKDGTIIAIARASLTNTPNFHELTTLHSAGLAPGSSIRERLAALMARADLADATRPPSPPTPVSPAAPALSAADQVAIRSLGLDPAAYAANLAPADPRDGLNKADLDMIERMGLDRAAYAREKAAMRGQA